MLLNCGVGEDSLESLECKEIQPVHPKGDQSWVFIGRTDVEAETPILWPPDAKSWLIGKDPDAGKDWRQKEKETEDEMVGWYHQLSGHGFEQTLGDSEGQGSLACCSPQGHRRAWWSHWTTTAAKSSWGTKESFSSSLYCAHTGLHTSTYCRGILANRSAERTEQVKRGVLSVSSFSWTYKISSHVLQLWKG